MNDIDVREAALKKDDTGSNAVQAGYVADPDVDLDRAKRLANAVQSKIIAESEVIGRCKGKITIEAFPKGHGYDINLNLTI